MVKHRSRSKKNGVFAFFFFYFPSFSKCHILWNIVANIQKKNYTYTSEITKFSFTEKKQVCWIITWLCKSIFSEWKNVFFFLTLISFLGMDFQKFSGFYQVVGLSSYGDDKFLQNAQKCDFIWLTMEKLSGFIMKLSKNHSRKI